MNAKLSEIAASLQTKQFEAAGNIYHPLPFPEFAQLTTSTKADSAHEKLSLIRGALGGLEDKKNLRVLDVGANAGFYSFSFAKSGAEVDAFEPHKHYCDIGRQIAAAADLKVNWHNKPLEKQDITGKQYDVALLLSVFQWMSNGNEQLDEATDVLRHIASITRMVFFELGCNQGKSAINTTERPLAWMWRLLTEATAPKQVAYLGSAVAWGKARRYMFVCADDEAPLSKRQKLVTLGLRRGLIR